MVRFKQFLESQQHLKETDYNGLVKKYKGIPGLKIKIVDVGTDRRNKFIIPVEYNGVDISEKVKKTTIAKLDEYTRKHSDPGVLFQAIVDGKINPKEYFHSVNDFKNISKQEKQKEREEKERIEKEERIKRKEETGKTRIESPGYSFYPSYDNGQLIGYRIKNEETSKFYQYPIPFKKYQDIIPNLRKRWTQKKFKKILSISDFIDELNIHIGQNNEFIYDTKNKNYQEYKEFIDGEIEKFGNGKLSSHKTLEQKLIDDNITMEDIEHHLKSKGLTIDDFYRKPNLKQQYYNETINKKRKLLSILDKNGVDFDEDDSIESLEKILLDNNIEIKKYSNLGIELERNIEKTLNKILDPKVNKSIKISDESNNDPKFKTALKVLKLTTKDKLLKATRTGNNDYSDIEIDWNSNVLNRPKNIKKFFIEAKLDYSKAASSHFHVRIENGKLHTIDSGNIKSSAEKSGHIRQYTDFDNYLASDQSVTGILQKSDELKEFYKNYETAINRLNRNINQKNLKAKISIDKKVTFPDALEDLSDLCDEYIEYYISKYEKYLQEFVDLNKKSDENLKLSIKKEIRKYFPNKKSVDDSGLNSNKKILKYFNNINDTNRAKQIIIEIRNIHNKFGHIITHSNRNIDSLSKADKSLFILWSFISASKNNRKDKINLENFGITYDENGRSRRLLQYKTKDNQDIKILIDVVRKYYNTLKDVLYIQIGSDTYYISNTKGEKIDPFGIIDEYNLSELGDSIDEITLNLNVQDDLSILFQIRIKPKNQNNFAFDTSITGGKQIRKITY